jgi:hypothetical protein
VARRGGAGVPDDVGEQARRGAARTAVVAWFRRRAAARLPERLERFTAKLGLAPPRLPATRSGSPLGLQREGRGRLWRIVQAPMLLVDYVAAHEAVHLIHRTIPERTGQSWRGSCPTWTAAGPSSGGGEAGTCGKNRDLRACIDTPLSFGRVDSTISELRRTM